MKTLQKFLIALTLLPAMLNSQTTNPFFEPFNDTVHSTPPFSKVNAANILEAVKEGIIQGEKEIDDIVNNPEPPTFENTIVAFTRSGELLNRTLGVAYPLMSALNDDSMMELAVTISPLLSEYSTKITLNQPLWERIKTVYAQKDSLGLKGEDAMLLETTYDGFALSGANLQGDKREEFKKIRAELSELTTKFGQNVQKELNSYEIWLTADDLDGLTPGTIAEAAELAEQKGRKGEYLFTLAQPTYMAFMKNSSRRDLREKMYRLYMGRNMGGEFDNLENIKKISLLRYRLANLLGHPDYATHSLQKTMAGNPQAVYNLLDNLRDAYRPAQIKEFEALNQYIAANEPEPFTLMPWDYSYYSNKLKERDYSYNEEELRPYFRLENVIDGVFGLATKLYGVSFVENNDIEVYHPDVKAYDVVDEDGSFLGVLYTDFFPRDTKRPGAWMTNFKEQWTNPDGSDDRPQVSIVMNFTKPTADTPSLLTPYEVETFLHEFGHSLHGLLAKGKYSALSGTNVYRDFVELPSQFNENYLTEKEFLDGFARHYQTGEPIPSELIEKMVAASQFGAAYACLRQLMFGYLDMAWHTATDSISNPVEFERTATESVAMFPDIDGTLTSPQFSHIFSGGYAAGYYSYKWSEVLDADAFDEFKQHGIFDKETARRFRKNILEKGGSENPAELYRRFRGKDATVEALLKRDGILPSTEQPISNPDLNISKPE